MECRPNTIPHIYHHRIAPKWQSRKRNPDSLFSSLLCGPRYCVTFVRSLHPLSLGFLIRTLGIA